jgi:hypothetical protein
VQTQQRSRTPRAYLGSRIRVTLSVNLPLQRMLTSGNKK